MINKHPFFQPHSMDSHNIFVFHLKFGGFQETHFATRIGQGRKERETMCWKA
jgi:hypothetical protein